MQPQLFAGYRQARVRRIDGDYDVFGDGRVRIVRAPGHTPGSAVLWVGLASGPVVLSGDLWVSRRSRAERWVPRVNADRAATLSSMARIERLARRTHARVIVQHDPEDYAALPKLPEFLE
jgi:glyoxylase-like metal-dependent hydrolase (beta-lactamase superfamily II)